MSSIRKLKLYKFLRKKKKISSRLSLGEIVFYIGIATILAGIFYGIYNYCVYTSGTPEQTIETKGGPIHLTEEAPGNQGRRDSITASLKITGFGILLILLSMAISIIDEVLLATNEKREANADGKQNLRKGK